MKCFLKKSATILLAVLIFVENFGFFTNIFGYNVIINGIELTVVSEKIFDDRKDRLLKTISSAGNFFNDKILVFDCGMYGNVLRNGKDREYEAHHLISNHFCRNHMDIISCEEAPAVLIPKAVHRNTGSYGNSALSKEYFIEEEKRFEFGGLKAVLEFGIDDLKNAFIKSGIEDTSFLDPCSIVSNKLYAYVNLLDAIYKKEQSKVSMLLKNNVFTIFKRKTLSRIDQLINCKNGDTNLKRERENEESPISTPLKSSKKSRLESSTFSENS